MKHKLLYTSSYDRGLENLLLEWDTILEKFPNTTLDIAYGWNLFDTFYSNNPERMKWKADMISLMSQKGITEHGRLGKQELRTLREQCTIFAYPATFQEINCISLREACRDGCVPVTTSLAALKESNITGIQTPIIIDEHTRKEYIRKLLVLMADDKEWKRRQVEGRKWAQQFSWDEIGKEWVKNFNTSTEDVKVSVYTPTIRKGWWNIMAHTLAMQKHQNFEWIIVDDIGEERVELAKEMSRKYDLDIKYIHGKKKKVQRNYGLVNANNTALEWAKGEVFVFLQDFILLKKTGLSDIVYNYKHHPTSLQALPDRYFKPSVTPDKNSEDWFNGKTGQEVIGEFIRKNIRIKNQGFRFTENPYDFEQNWGAIPTKIAKELGGWHEFFDFGLGYDNTDIAYRALLAGYTILLDENNDCVCIDHFETLAGDKQNGLKRERRLNDPLFVWMCDMIEKGKIPLKRTQEIDDSINLTYEIPETVLSKDCDTWMRNNLEKIVDSWGNVL